MKLFPIKSLAILNFVARKVVRHTDKQVLKECALTAGEILDKYDQLVELGVEYNEDVTLGFTSMRDNAVRSFQAIDEDSSLVLTKSGRTIWKGNLRILADLLAEGNKVSTA